VPKPIFRVRCPEDDVCGKERTSDFNGLLVPWKSWGVDEGGFSGRMVKFQLKGKSGGRKG